MTLHGHEWADLISGVLGAVIGWLARHFSSPRT